MVIVVSVVEHVSGKTSGGNDKRQKIMNRKQEDNGMDDKNNGDEDMEVRNTDDKNMGAKDMMDKNIKE